MLAILTYFVCLLLPALLLWFGYGILHESGHALAALLLGRGPVTVFLGTYGQRAGTWALRLGRVQIHTAYNVFWWRGGYCDCPALATAPPWRRLAFILAGPLFPLPVAGLVGWLGLQQDHRLGMALALMLLGLTVLGTALTLWPLAQPTVLADGRLVYNDGRAALNLLRSARQTRALNALLAEAEAHCAAGEYVPGADLYGRVLAQAKPTPGLLRAGIYVLLQAGRYAEALPLSIRFQQDFEGQLTDADRFTQGLLLSRTDQHAQALAEYTRLIEQPRPYARAYVNRGYTYHLLGKYELALADFDQAITCREELAYVYANRGLSLLKLGQETAGLADINYSLVLDPANAYGYRSLGICHLDRGEYAAALACFERARQHDPTTHQLAEYEQKARLHLESSKAGGQSLVAQ